MTLQYLGGTEIVGWEGLLNILIVVVTNLAQGLNPCAKCKMANKTLFLCTANNVCEVEATGRSQTGLFLSNQVL